MTGMPRGLHWRVGATALAVVLGAFTVALGLFLTLGLVAGLLVLTAIVLTGALTIRVVERVRADEELRRRRVEREREQDAEIAQAAREWNAREIARRVRRAERGEDAA